MSAGTEDGETDTAPRHTIGELLRETRQSYGGDIERIAATLRIRPSYLSAIEQGEFDKLPGPVYAQGFVRAYAVHLGLDGDEAIRRFKQEVEGLDVTRDLSFPVPLAPRSIPGGTMVLAALILAVCGYGLWYYVSTGDRTHPERVSAVPPDLVAASQPPSSAPVAPQAAPAAPTDGAAPAPMTSAAATTGAVIPPPPVTALTPATAASTPTPPVAPSLAPLSSPTAPGAVSAPSVPATPIPAPVAVAGVPAAMAPSPASTSPAGPVASATPATATAPAPLADAAVTPAPAQPRVYGAPANVPTRIVIHAIKDSWVQLRDGDDILVQRLLHPGDTVRIPDERGLVMRTGNGAGIELEVDGKLGKPLSGTVRTLDLDPDQINGGTVPRGD